MFAFCYSWQKLKVICLPMEIINHAAGCKYDTLKLCIRDRRKKKRSLLIVIKIEEHFTTEFESFKQKSKKAIDF